MTFDAFCLLSDPAQLYWVLKYGTYLARRFENERGVNLYHCANEGRGFFAEVSYDEGRDRLILRSFVASEPLEEYGHGVRLPKW